MQKHILSSLLFTMTIATYAAETPTQEKNNDVALVIISRGYPQKNYAQKSPAEILQNIILDKKEETYTQDNSLKNLNKSRLFVIDKPSKL